MELTLNLFALVQGRGGRDFKFSDDTDQTTVGGLVQFMLDIPGTGDILAKGRLGQVVYDAIRIQKETLVLTRAEKETLKAAFDHYISLPMVTGELAVAAEKAIFGE